MKFLIKQLLIFSNDCLDLHHLYRSIDNSLYRTSHSKNYLSFFSKNIDNKHAIIMHRVEIIINALLKCIKSKSLTISKIITTIKRIIMILFFMDALLIQYQIKIQQLYLILYTRRNRDVDTR